MDPIFVIGHPKSGTSLLNSLLDNHPNLLVLSEESDFYQGIWQQAKKLNQAWRKSPQQKIEILYNYIIQVTHFRNYLRGKVESDISGNLDYEHLNSEEFKKSLKNNLSHTLVNGKFERVKIIQVLLEEYRKLIPNAQSNYKYWVEKTPKHTWFIDDILLDWPKASFIFVYRDPRDNFVSYKKKIGDSLTVAKFCKTWNDAIQRYDSIPATTAKIMVCYEQLIKNKEEEIERIADFLNIKVEESLFEPTKMGKVWKGNSMFNLSSAEMHDKSIGRYESALNLDEINAIEYFTLANLQRLGYVLKTQAERSGLKNYAQLKAEYDAYYPFNIGKPESLRAKLGLLKRRLIG